MLILNVLPVYAVTAVTEVSLDIDSIDIEVGESKVLVCLVSPCDATNKEVYWNSSDPSVATVDETGTVTGVAEGTAIVTVTTVDGEFTAECEVEVTQGKEEDKKENIAVTGVSLDKSSIEVSIDETDTLIATIAPYDATNKEVYWNSSDPSVAKVDETGTVTGVAEGIAIVTVTTVDGKFTAECEVEVTQGKKEEKKENIAVTGISLDKSSIEVSIDDTDTLIATIAPENATSKEVYWNSSDPSVATVDETGTVTGVAEGTAIVTVTTVDGEYTGICSVEVIKKTIRPSKRVLVKFKEGRSGLENKVVNKTLKSYLEKDQNKDLSKKVDGKSEALDRKVWDEAPKIKEYKKLKQTGNIYTAEMDSLALSCLSEDPDIEMIEEDTVVTKLGDITPWNIENIKAPFLHNQDNYGTGIKVAVFDTGIDLNNSDLQVAGGVSFVEGITSYDDDNGHGTAMAGILAALQNEQGLLGIAPEVSLYSVKVLDQEGIGYYSQIIDGIQWAIENDIDIITMSFGGTQYSNILRESIQEANDNNILIIAASGNQGSFSAINYPANFNEVVCVGAVDNQNNIASFSNRGTEMDIVAPGVNIQTTGLNNSLVTVNGTSAAVPHVAGVAAQLWSIKNELTNDELKALLYVSAERMGEHNTSGWGLVNAEQAYIFRDTQLDDFPVDNVPNPISPEDAGGGGVVTASALVSVDGNQINDGVTIYKDEGEQTQIVITFSDPHNRCNILINGQLGLIAPVSKYPAPKAQNYYIQNIAAGDTFTYIYQFNTEGTYSIRFHCTEYQDDTYDRYFNINVSEPPIQAVPVTEGIYYGCISYGGEEDYYKLTTSTAGFYTIRTLGSLDTTGYLYRSDLSQILFLHDNYNTNDENILISERLDANTVYYIKITGDDNSDVGNYVLQIIKEDYGDYVWRFGYNWTMKNLDTLIPANIDYNGDYDVIGFSTQEAGNYVIKTTGSTDTYGYLYDLNTMYGDPITESGSGGEGNNFLISRTLAANTVYMVVVKHASLNGTGAYNLFFGHNDDHGNTFDNATVISDVSLTNGNIQYNGDVDFFKFQASAEGVYTVETTGTTDTFGTIYDGDRNEVDSDDDSGQGNINFKMCYYLSANQICYVKVNHAQSGGTGQYQLQVSYQDITLPEIIEQITYGNPTPWCAYGLEPVNLITGNYFSEDKDLSISTRSVPLEFVRHYNSLSDDNGSLGKGWQHNYNSFLTFNQDNSITVTYGDGHKVNFALDNGDYTAQAGAFEILTDNMDGTYSLLFKNQSEQVYDSTGKLLQIVDKNSNTTTLQYNGSLLSSVTEPGGRSLQFTYNANNKLSQVTDPAGRTLEFTYDAEGNLVTFEDLNGNITTYGYDTNGLTSVLDPLNHYIVRNTYDNNGRVVTQLDSKGQAGNISYDDVNRVNTVTDNRNNDTLYYYDDNYRVTRILYPNGEDVEYTYDDDYNRISETDANGNTTLYTYDARGNLLTQTAPSPLSYTTTFAYDSKNNPGTITDRAGNTTNNTYDVNSNLITTSKTVNGQTVTQTLGYNQYGQLTSVFDANGKMTEMTYDQYGNLQSTTDPLNNETTFTYDIIGRMLSKTDERGAVWSYTYDNKGNLLTEIDPLANTVTNVYDAVDNLISTQDRRGLTTTFTYDENDRLIQKTDPLGNTTTVTYDANGNKTAITDGNNNTTQYVYDTRNRLVQVTDSDNNSESYNLDGNGNILIKTDKRGKTTTYQYDVLNRPTQITDPLNGITQYTYDALGNILSETDPLNHTTSYTYDEANHLLSETDSLNNQTQYTYDLVGNRLTMTNALNKTWTYQYDDANRLIQTTDPLGKYTQNQYDEVGNITAQIDAKGNTTQYTYDLNSQLITVTDALNHQTSYTYDGNGNKLSMTDANNQTWSYQYDNLDRLIRITDPLGEYTQTGYDAVGNITSKTDAKGNTTSYSYNGQGQITTVTDSLNNITTYQYDGNDNLITVTDAKGNIRTFEYDDLNRQITETNNGRIIQKTYDLAGNMTTKTKPDNSIITYTYDNNNRLTNISYPDSTSVTYQYNGIGLRTFMTDTQGPTGYTYNDLGRLSTVTRNNMTVTYTYDDVGNISGITYPDNTQVNYTHNQVNLLTTATEGSNNLNITYDPTNRRTSETMPNGVTVNYQYDNAGQLTVLDHILSGTSLAKTIYTIDENNNRISKTNENNETTNYTYDQINQLTQVNYPSGKTVEYIHDQVGNRTQTNIEGDIQIILPEDTIDYEYNSEDRLTQVQEGDKTITYTYDGDGNLISKTITEGINTDTYEYFYDYSAGLPRLLVETKNSTEVTNYLYAGRLYAKKTTTGTVYYHQDGLGSILAITDQTGTILNKYEYDVYGTPEAIQETIENCILFTGEMYDDGSGLYYLRARYYNPSTGRFMTPDTYFGELDNPISQNLYIYCANNPVNYVDPSGHIRCSILNIDTDAFKQWLKEKGYQLSSFLSGAYQAVIEDYSYNIYSTPDGPNTYGYPDEFYKGKQLGHVFVMTLSTAEGTISIGLDGTIVAAPAGAAVGVHALSAGAQAVGNAVRDEIMYAKNNGNNIDKQRKGTPGNNKAQNKQVRDIVNELKLDKAQQRELHDAISGQNYTYQEILEVAKSMFNK